MPTEKSRATLEAKAEQLRNDVLTGKARYEAARRELENLQEIARKLGSGALYNTQAVTRAAASLDAALVDYQAAVEHFSEFVLGHLAPSMGEERPSRESGRA